MGISKSISILVLAATLTACGGGSSNTDTTAPAAPTTSSVTSANDGSITISGKSRSEFYC